MELEYKQFNTKALDVDKTRVKIALANFTEIDKVGDLIDPKAFDNTLKENPKKWYFINHNPDLFVKRFDEMYTDSTHLIAIAELNVENSNAKDLLTAYQAGEIEEHSIGYFVKRKETVIDDSVDSQIYDYESWDWVNGYRLLKEIDLWEGSALTVPAANPNTPFLGFTKNLESEQLVDLIKKQQKSIELTLKSKPTRQGWRMLEYKYFQLKKLQRQLAKIEPGKNETIQEDQNKQAENIQKENSINFLNFKL